jgi:hypothetical protein
MEGVDEGETLKSETPENWNTLSDKMLQYYTILYYTVQSAQSINESKFSI